MLYNNSLNSIEFINELKKKKKKHQDDQYDIQLCLVQSPYQPKSSLSTKPITSPSQTKAQSSPRSPSSPKSPLQTKTHSSPRSPSFKFPTSLRTKEQKTDRALHNILIRNFNFGQN